MAAAVLMEPDLIERRYGRSMYLVRHMAGRKPRIFVVDPREIIGAHSQEEPHAQRRKPRAWWLLSNGIRVGAAAIGDTVAQCYMMLATLKGEAYDDDAGP